MSDLSTVQNAVRSDVDGDYIVSAQDIPEGWSDWLAQKRRDAWELRNSTEHVHVASVPTIFIHKWLKEGFNAYLAPVKDVVKRLREESLEGFLATEKRAI